MTYNLIIFNILSVILY